MRFNFLVLLFTMLLIPGFCYSQESKYEQSFEWVKKTFEENDAGFQYILDKKGEDAYKIHNALTLEQVRKAKNMEECTRILNNWLLFFRSGHIGLQLLNDKDTEGGDSLKKNSPKPIYEIIDIDIPEFERYISQKEDTDYEGIWESLPYKVGIKKEKNVYIGFIIESSVDTWKRGQTKFKIFENDEGKRAIYYLRDHTPVEYNFVEMIGKNYLQIGQTKLKRLNPKQPTEEVVENYFKAMFAGKPYLQVLNETTLLLRISSFDYHQKAGIDKVIQENRKRILSTENLIIDLRDNGGGADRSFAEILPLLYTNPIRIVGVEFFSTPLNNEFFQNLATDPTYGLDEEGKKWALDSFQKLNNQLGKFVNIHSEKVRITELDTIYTYPKNVGIIINKGNASTTEQFLLAARQSKKVKLFGTATSGALDVSNVYGIESPNKDLKLYICLSKSLRLPEMPIDEIGIQPDYYMDKEIPLYQWVEYANEILNSFQDKDTEEN